MKPNYSTVLHVAFVFLVGVSLQLTKGSFNASPRLEDVIEEAERESKILADEINGWLLQESASLLKEDEDTHFRSRRSIDEDDEDTRTDTNSLSEVSHFIVRRDVRNKDQKYHEKKNGVPVIKTNNKKVNSLHVGNRDHQNVRSRDSIRLSKKQGLDIQVDKHHAKKGATNKKADKLKTKTNAFSKANFVKALIGGDSGAKRNVGVPEKAYRELVEFIAGSDQPTIETSSNNSDIVRPSSKTQGIHKKLTKKHKRVLEILSKLAPNVLKKYFHRKGLDKYWNVMDNIKKTKTAKQSKKERKVVDETGNINAAKQSEKEAKVTDNIMKMNAAKQSKKERKVMDNTKNINAAKQSVVKEAKVTDNIMKMNAANQSKKDKKVMDNIRNINFAKQSEKETEVRKNIMKMTAAKHSKKERKVMDTTRTMNAAKKISKTENLKEHKDEKTVKQVKVVALKKLNSSMGIKHPEKDVLLKKQVKSKKDLKKEVSQHKLVKDNVTEKVHKPEVIIVKPAEETQPKISKKVKDGATNDEKKQSYKTTVELHPTRIPRPDKDDKKNLFKAIKSKDVVKVEKKDRKIASGKSSQASNEAASHEKDSLANKAHEKLKSPVVKDTPKQQPTKKVLKTVAVKETAPPENIKDKSKDVNNSTALATKAAKFHTSQITTPASLIQLKKPVKTIQVVKNKDSSTHHIANGQPNPQDQKATPPQHQVKAVAVSITNKMTNKNSSIVAEKKPKEIPKTLAATAHHVIKTTHAQQLEVKHGESSQATQENPASGKIDFLKEKIRKTNNLKFKVAQALLAHCETQNKLRQVFEDVNSSLKKATLLAKAIGTKFGIKQSDIEKMTSEHTEGAVEQFLNQLF